MIGEANTIDAAALQIVRYPAKILRTVAAPLPDPEPGIGFGPEVRAVADRMIALMRRGVPGAGHGVGLAATQVGLPWRLFVAHVPEAPGRGWSADQKTQSATLLPQVFINPRIVSHGVRTCLEQEGCLSMPGVVGHVSRHRSVVVASLDLDGVETTRAVGGLLARVVQHEIDHLNGVLITDKFTRRSKLDSAARVHELEAAGVDLNAKGAESANKSGGGQ